MASRAWIFAAVQPDRGCRRLRRRSTKFGCQFLSPAEHHAGSAAGTPHSLRRSNASANYFEWLQADLCIGLIFAHRREPVLELRFRADSLKNLGCGRLLFVRFVQFAAKPRDLGFLAGSGGVAMAHSL